MKKVLNLIQWLSFAVTMLTVMLGSLYAGAYTCSLIEDALNITGWWGFVLTPVLYAVSIGIFLFFMQGVKKMQWEK